MDIKTKLAKAGVEVKDGKIKKSDVAKVLGGMSDVQLRLEVVVWAEVEGDANIEKLRQNLLDMVTEAEVSGKMHEGTDAVLYDVSSHAKVEKK